MVMVIHEPLFAVTNNQYKLSDWIAVRSLIKQVVEKELDHLHEYKFTRDLDVLPDHLLSCAAYLYYLLIKQPTVEVDDDILEISDDLEEVSPPNQKRMKTSSVLEKLLNKIRPHEKKFVWRWFVALGSALHLRPALDLPANEINALVELCSFCVDELTYDRQFKALYRICQYLVETNSIERVCWDAITNGVYKLATKFQSQIAMELLQFVLASQLCSPKLTLKIYTAIKTTPVDNINLKCLTLMYRTDAHKEILGDSLMDNEEIIQYLNSNGGFILSRKSFANSLEWLLICLNIPMANNKNHHSADNNYQCLESTPFEVEMKRITLQLEFKDTFKRNTNLEELHSTEFNPPVELESVNRSLLRKIFKSIFVDVDDKQHVSMVIQLKLQQLEITTMFLEKLSVVQSIKELDNFTSDILKRFEEILKALNKLFRYEISEKNSVNQVLEAVRNFLSIDYIKTKQKLLVETGFTKTVALWTFHQLAQEKNVQETKLMSENGTTSNSIIKRNALVLEVLVRIGAIDETTLRDYWDQIKINNVTDIKLAFEILKVRMLIRM